MTTKKTERNAAMLAEYEAGTSQRDLGTKYGIARSRVQKILEQERISRAKREAMAQISAASHAFLLRHPVTLVNSSE